MHDDLSRPQSTTSVQTNGNIGAINMAYMDDDMKSRIEVKNEKKLMRNDICLTAKKVVYERIVAEVRFDEDSSKEYSTNKGFVNPNRTAPSPFSNEDYIEIFPFNAAKQSLGSSTTENGLRHKNGLENETVTSL